MIGTPEVDISRTIGGELERAALADPDRTLLRCAGRDVVAAALERRSRFVAGALQAWGVGPGVRVAVMMGNVPEFLEAWFGIVRVGAIEIPIHMAYRGPLLRHVLAESGASVLFCDEHVVDRLDGLDIPDLRRLVVRGAARAVPARMDAHEYEELIAGAPWPELPTLTGEDVSCILYTSGTTGPSKGVVLTHGANLHPAASAIEFMGWGREDTLYTAFPLFHVNAKFTSVMAALIAGARLVVDEHFSASRFWDRMREERITGFNAMGAMLAMLYNQPPQADDRDHLVNRTYCAATPPALWRPFEQRFGVRLHEHYGMTEIGIATCNWEGRVGSCGVAAPWFHVRLADDHDRDTPPGEVGEIQVRPQLPGIALKEYWRRPETTLEAMRNLWFHTGDRARQDADGFFYFVDRIKDSIRRRGENISSWEVESVVSAFEGVAEVAAFGVPLTGPRFSVHHE